MKKTILLFTVAASLLASQSFAAIIEIREVGLAADMPATIGRSLGEDSLLFSDRTHQHNGSAFDAGTGLLNTAGTTIVPLPDYLLGADYILFANNARENVGYEATATADLPTKWYLLVDNRLDGATATGTSPNSSDPVLQGTLQWVVDGGWVRVNTGISPNGQADYTGADEGGDGVGAGAGLNQFFSVYTLEAASESVTVKGPAIPGNNMISLVGVPVPEEDDPISSFVATPLTISEGSPTDLSWLIHKGATLASIDNGIGDILPSTSNGSGTMSLTPTTTTTYTLNVESPDGDESAEATVVVRLLESFTAEVSLIEPGDSTTLSWQTRSDATVTLSGVGIVPGDATSAVSPTEDTTYTLTAVAGEETETAEVSVRVTAAGELYALLDLGATDGTVEVGALTGAQIGAGANNINATNLPLTNLTSETGDDFTIEIDNLDTEGNAVGNLDWRDRGTASGEKWTAIGEDHFKNNAGVIRVTLGGLPAGEYQMLSWHFDPTFSQGENIQILVTDANGTAVDTGVVASAFANPTISAEANTTANMADHAALFNVESNGTDAVILYFDGRLGADTEIPLNGLQITSAGAPEPPRIVSIVLDEAAKTATLEFTSKPGREYSVFSSTDLKDFDNEEADSLPGEDGTTTYVVTGVDTAVLVREFYRVERTR